MMPAETLQATLPEGAKDALLVAMADPESPAAQQFHVLHQRLLRIGAHRPLRTIAVTSAGRREGRTTTAANLALAAAQEGRQTVLVEADLRHPSLAAGLGLAPRAGLAEVILGAAELGQAVVRLGTLAVLCAGEVHDAGALVRSPRAAAVVEQLRTAYEFVVLDAPPALAFSDGDRIAASADAALLVARARATPRDVVHLAVESLGDRVVGIVLNDVEPGSLAHGRWIFGEDGDARVG